MTGTGVPATLGATSVASDILESLVMDLKIRPGDYVHETPVRVAFQLRGLPDSDIRAGLEHASHEGWLLFDPELRVYRLTKTGFEMGAA